MKWGVKRKKRGEIKRKKEKKKRGEKKEKYKSFLSLKNTGKNSEPYKEVADTNSNIYSQFLKSYALGYG